MNDITDTPAFSLLPGSMRYDAIEDRLRARVRATIETMFEEELAEFLDRMRTVAAARRRRVAAAVTASGS